ncbi:hypothetical protein BOTBODRAFT_636603 [Botryobasidium botryosum FD-172 SS1]|uniref:Uncharacterized protein n=1 Tax=Botryobasidium botryosum (strain FD-172 SS1) TaxID=930990 RepID=A0A067MY42_BOTB1|nr:hypothetical protein BOTBODRAFT_636603 [Botryobasidium botryosum FD-172 SS1]
MARSTRYNLPDFQTLPKCRSRCYLFRHEEEAVNGSGSIFDRNQYKLIRAEYFSTASILGYIPPGAESIGQETAIPNYCWAYGRAIDFICPALCYSFVGSLSGALPCAFLHTVLSSVPGPELIIAGLYICIAVYFHKSSPLTPVRVAMHCLAFHLAMIEVEMAMTGGRAALSEISGVEQASLFPIQLSLFAAFETIPKHPLRSELAQAVPIIRDFTLNLRYRDSPRDDESVKKLEELLVYVDQALQSLERLHSATRPLSASLLIPFDMLKSQIDKSLHFSTRMSQAALARRARYEMYRHSPLITELCIKELLFYGEEFGYWVQKLECGFWSVLEDIVGGESGALLEGKDANTLLVVWNSLGGDHAATHRFIKAVNIASNNHAAFRTPPRRIPPFEI